MSIFLVSSTLLWKYDLTDIVEAISTNGWQGMELWAEQFWHRQYSAKEFRQLAFSHPSLMTTVHASSWDLNLSSLNEGIRQASVNEVIRSMELARSIGAREVTVHPGHMTKPCCRAYSAEKTFESFQRIAEVSLRLDMPVSLEIMEKEPKEFVTTVEAMKEVTGSLYSFFSYTVDVAHCDSPAEALTMVQTIGHLSKIHLSNRQGHQYHTPLGNGDFHIEGFLPVLEKSDVPFVVEGYDPQCGDRTFKENTAWLKERGYLEEKTKQAEATA